MKNLYGSEEIYDLEKKTIIQTQWFCIGHISDFEALGSYRTIEIFEESILVVNGKDGLNAFWNICPHRGSQLKSDSGSDLEQITCPYHGWSFDLNGQCVSRRLISDCSANEMIRLSSLKLIIKWGLIFISPNGSSTEFNASAAKIDKVISLFLNQDLKCVSKENLETRTNWKLFVENFLECYHCYINHPELSDVERFVKDYEEKGGAYRTELINTGTSVLNVKYLANFTQDVPYMISSSALANGRRTETRSGELVGPSLIEAKDSGGHVIFGMLTPFLHFTINIDHIVLFIFHPKAPEKTNVQVIWYVRKGTDLKVKDKNDLTWLWENTIRQDILLTEGVQRNAKSCYFSENYYHSLEYDSRLFQKWYTERLMTASS